MVSYVRQASSFYILHIRDTLRIEMRLMVAGERVTVIFEFDGMGATRAGDIEKPPEHLPWAETEHRKQREEEPL